ncbi:hypothetical protein OOZ51_22430, partial [Arthrobacter sp. MI7-26]|uniref:2-oxo-4-hydroxy-4-carboxy-5-ureidoimidazoline decarboxylase n=1 Tax=Arthrobacter sp. MI7-26 TaxID=2993653 RepID=UPI002A016DEB
PTTSRALPEADPGVLREQEQPWSTVLRLCEDYKARFGYIYLVNVSGKTDETIVSELKSRLTLSPHEDLKIVQEELHGIVMDRLRLLAVPPIEGGNDLESEKLQSD